MLRGDVYLENGDQFKASLFKLDNFETLEMRSGMNSPVFRISNLFMKAET